MKSPSKKSVATKCGPVSCKNNKDWHGAHWHVVGWLAAVAVMLSVSTMTLSASAATSETSPDLVVQAINNLNARLDRMEIKLNALESVAPEAKK